jgi:ankyrin repeat protein
LLNHGAEVNVEAGLYGCALNAAIRQKHKDAVGLLLSKGADINQFCASEKVPHDTRIINYSSGDLEVVRGFSYGLLSNERFCETPLNNAIVAGDISIVTSLLRAGSRLLQDDKICSRPAHSLCEAILTENMDMVDLLLRNGANLKVGNYCALVKAASKSSFPIIKLLFDQVEDDTSNMNSAISEVIAEVGDETIGRDLIPILERVFDPNESEQQGHLVNATVKKGCLALTKFLLEHGFTPNVSWQYRDPHHYEYTCGSPLSNAIFLERMDLFELLLEYGADVNLTDEKSGYLSKSPLFEAVVIRNTEEVTRLLALGALPNRDTCCNGKCSVILPRAATNNDPYILEELLKHGADLTASCYTCSSALMAAVRTQSLDAILILVRKGANVNEPDLFGCTPLSRAKDSCLELAIARLLELQAEESISSEGLRSRLEKTVELLVSRLLQPDPLWDLDLLSCSWINLGRCLILGQDRENGAIALEQTLYTARWYTSLSKGLPYPTCYYCVGYISNSDKHHLCEDCCEGVFCERCIERHLILARKSTYSHSVTEFPRELLRDVPEGQVALDENTYLPVQAWLEGLQGWTAKL